MNSQILGLRVASAAFGLICFAHLLRIIIRVQIFVGHIYIYRWMSAVAAVVTGLLCVWLWTPASKAVRAKQGWSSTPPMA